MVGTPAMIADTMQDLFESEGCDGFVLTPTISPLMWKEFARMLTPELQRRGLLLRTEYTGATMREEFAQLSGTRRGGEGGAASIGSVARRRRWRRPIVVARRCVIRRPGDRPHRRGRDRSGTGDDRAGGNERQGKQARSAAPSPSVVPAPRRRVRHREDYRAHH